jgi:hypothetical protein
MGGRGQGSSSGRGGFGGNGRGQGSSSGTAARLRVQTTAARTFAMQGQEDPGSSDFATSNFSCAFPFSALALINLGSTY